MLKKRTIMNLVFVAVLCYIISPWFFEKILLFNELLAITGFLILVYKKFRIEKNEINLYIFLLLSLGFIHLLTSLWRLDFLYVYLRNSVIIYSVFSFFIGYFGLKYLEKFILQTKQLLTLYIGFFLFLPFSKFLFERFGMSTLFPALLKKQNLKYGLPVLIFLCFLYALIYSSATIMVLCLFYTLLLTLPGYKAFKQFVGISFILFVVFFIVIQPNLALMDTYYSVYDSEGMFAVMRSNPLLAIDPSTTWRFVFWRQAIVDQFPNNIIGIGFGTPLFKYFPVYDIEKLSILPYVMGAHNSYVYLFARLGIVYVLITAGIYRIVFKEYFYNKAYYYKKGYVAIFWSFFAISLIAFFNPVLESPIYASAYWILLGFTAKAIFERKRSLIKKMTA